MDSESYVLAALMSYTEIVDSVLDELPTEAFTEQKNRGVYRAIKTLRDDAKPVDFLTVSIQAEQEGVPGSYTASLMDYAVSSQINPFVKELLNKYGWKLLKDVSNTTLATSDLEKLPDLEEFRDSLLDKLTSFGPQNGHKTVSLGDQTVEYYKLLEARMSKGGELTGASTGFPRLDEITSGFQKQNLIVLGARPSVGKSAVAINILDHLAVTYRKPVLMFSLEMSRGQVEDRIWAGRSNVDIQSISKGRLSPAEMERIAHAGTQIDGAPILIDDSSFMTVQQMRTRIRRVLAKMKLALVVVDYVQLMRGTKEQREQEVSEISRGLKALAKEFDLPILALCQLNREVEQRNPPIPRLSDLRESGSLEQDADLAMLLYRKDAYEKDRSKHDGKAMLIVAKQRNGPTGLVHMAYSSHIAKFFPD